MNWLWNVTAIVLVSVASFEVGLVLAWSLLKLLMNSLRLASIPPEK
jgi:hypothetical protein